MSEAMDKTEQIKELALTAAMTEARLLLDELRDEAEGWRRRNLIFDSQIERQEAAIRRLEAVAAAWETQLSTIADLDRIGLSLKKLNTAILREAAASKKDPWDTVS